MNIPYKPSVLLAFAVWGTTGFMAQPTFSSLMIHLFIVPALLALIIWLAHWEAHKGSQR